MLPPDYRGKRVTIMGLGVLGGGVGAARWFARQGAIVTVTDTRDEAALYESIAQLGDLPIIKHLGNHVVQDFTSEGADIVVRNPGVPMDSPWLNLARDSHISIEMEMSIFFRVCPSPIVGITGTKGKTTVSALVGQMLTQWRPDSLIAGNMGISALNSLATLSPETPVAIELSSFQIESLNIHQLSPHVAVYTNITPDHLDRYAGFDHYADTKRDMAQWMSSDDVLVINADDPETVKIPTKSSARVIEFGLGSGRSHGAWLIDNTLRIDTDWGEISTHRPDHLALAGDHGARNALAAAAAALAYGVPPEIIIESLHSFTGVENRLETIRTIAGVTWVNDTSATAPIAAVAGVTVLAPRAKTLHVIAGGADKQTDLAPFADALTHAAAQVYLLQGSATQILNRLLNERGVAVIGTFDSMQAVVDAAAASAQEGDVVALCPGCASFGMFRNEFDRGAQFRKAVLALQKSSDARYQ